MRHDLYVFLLLFRYDHHVNCEEYLIKHVFF